jgi:hypothetical protein
LSLARIDELRAQKSIGEYMLFCSKSMDNTYVVILAPGDWNYELVEIFHPGAVWNRYGEEIAIGSDHEGRQGRNTYATIGGCYYAARLSVSEFLYHERKQATVTVLREARPGYFLPVGVWHVREGVKRALSSKPEVFSSIEKAIPRISSLMRCPISQVIRNSVIFRSMFIQSRLTSFMNSDGS